MEAENKVPGRLIEEKMHNYEKDCEERFLKKLQSELQFFRSHELEKAREEEQQKCQDELEKIHTSLRFDQEEKLRSLHKKEQDLKSEWESKQRDVETKLFEMRQDMFDKMDQLRTRESSLENKYAAEDRRLTAESHRLATLDETLRRREETLEQVIHLAKQAKENSLAIEKATWVAELEKREKILLSEEASISKEKESLETEKGRLESSKRDTGSLKEWWESSEAQSRSLANQLTQAEASIARSEQALAYKEELLQDFRSRYDKEHCAKVRRESENSLLVTENTNLRAKMQALEENETKLQRELAQLREEMIRFRFEEANTVVKGRKRILEIAESERYNFQRKEDEYLSRIHELRSQISEAEAASEKFRAQYEDETAHVESLRQEVRNLNLQLSRANSVVHTKHGYAHSRFKKPTQHFARHICNERFREARDEKHISMEQPSMAGMVRFSQSSAMDRFFQPPAMRTESYSTNAEMPSMAARVKEIIVEHEFREGSSIGNQPSQTTPMMSMPTYDDQGWREQLKPRTAERHQAFTDIEQTDCLTTIPVVAVDDLLEPKVPLQTTEKRFHDELFPRASSRANNTDNVPINQISFENDKPLENVRPAEEVSAINVSRMVTTQEPGPDVEEKLSVDSKHNGNAETEQKDGFPLEADCSVHPMEEEMPAATKFATVPVKSDVGALAEDTGVAMVPEQFQDREQCTETATSRSFDEQSDHTIQVDIEDLNDSKDVVIDGNNLSMDLLESKREDVMLPVDQHEEKAQIKDSNVSKKEKAQEDSLIDIYRERVLARRAAEKEQQQQEAERSRQSELITTEQISHTTNLPLADSDEEELEESSASFAESRFVILFRFLLTRIPTNLYDSKDSSDSF
uniref:AlNc14C135G7062 protein n=1 Tax=Albugo laibachii Nc14 TaxID=890382 RepID=F0W6G9_9STRA|nr:AlNc14C25G2469 [Albugo laibachii Nc14]CCA21819.1 AlNc14C135G7062 [Albugo laibachii Nc14]|eukprot:CCA21819.1 AlNc14C135G7062 [Albugo laibachii Nc14]